MEFFLYCPCSFKCISMIGKVHTRNCINGFSPKWNWVFPKSNVWNQLLIVIFHEKMEPSSSTSFGSWLWLWHLTIPTKLLYFLLSHLYKSNAWVNGKNCQKMCILIGAWKLSNFSSLIKDMNFNNLQFASANIII